MLAHPERGKLFAAAAMAAAMLLLHCAPPRAVAADFPQGLLLHFSFDQVEPGRTISDRSGRNHVGFIADARIIPAGKLGGALEPGRSNACVVVNASPDLAATQATVAVWFKAAGTNTDARIILHTPVPGELTLGVAESGSEGGAQNAGRLRVEAGGRSCLSDQSVCDGTWRHCAASYDGKLIHLYVDGRPQKETLHWQGQMLTGTNLFVGARGTGAPGTAFAGALDDFMIFNHCLTEAEIQEVMAAAKPKFTPQQVERRLKDLKELYNRGLLTKEFYERKVRECQPEP